MEVAVIAQRLVCEQGSLGRIGNKSMPGVGAAVWVIKYVRVCLCGQAIKDISQKVSEIESGGSLTP